MNTISAINKLANENVLDLIDYSEKEYKNETERLITAVNDNKNIKIVLLAGPSGSGKTTTAHIVKDRLFEKNIAAQVISLDNFYLTVDKMPKLKNGAPDFETVYSLDIAEINRCFYKLINSDKTKIPFFDFSTGKRFKEHTEIDIGGHGIIIVEGIHALNPILTELLPKENVLRVYISANASVYDDKGIEILSDRKIRLMRRISRDFIYRNTTAEGTLKLWTSVVAGEEKYLYCHKDTADIILSTFHSFEPCVFKDIIIKMLHELSKQTDNYEYAMELKSGLEMFVGIDISLVPDNSLIREFISGGKYENCK